MQPQAKRIRRHQLRRKARPLPKGPTGQGDQWAKMQDAKTELFGFLSFTKKSAGTLFHRVERAKMYMEAGLQIAVGARTVEL